MPTVEVQDFRWRKSSYSDGDGHNGACVEVGFAGSVTAVRDSKNPVGPALVFPADSWRTFLAVTD